MAQSYEEPDIDERTKYIRDYDGERRKRANRLFHWSLNMPPGEDDMNVWANRTGITWRELTAAGVIGLAAWGIYRSTSQPPPAASPAITESQPAVEPIRGKIRFWAEDGTEIDEVTEANGQE